MDYNWDKMQQDHDEINLIPASGYRSGWLDPVDKDIDDWKTDIHNEIKKQKQHGRIGYDYYEDWSQKHVIKSDLINSIKAIDPYFTTKRVHKLLKKCPWYDQVYIYRFMYLILRPDKEAYQQAKQAFKDWSDFEDNAYLQTTYLQTIEDMQQNNYDTLTKVFDNYRDEHWNALTNFLHYVAFSKYYCGAEADEGANKRVRELEDVVSLLWVKEPEGTEPSNYYLAHKQIAEHLDGWWD